MNTSPHSKKTRKSHHSMKSPSMKSPSKKSPTMKSHSMKSSSMKSTPRSNFPEFIKGEFYHIVSENPKIAFDGKFIKYLGKTAVFESSEYVNTTKSVETPNEKTDSHKKRRKLSKSTILLNPLTKQ